MVEGDAHESRRRTYAVVQEFYYALVLAFREAGWVNSAGEPVADVYELCFPTRGDHVDEGREMMAMDEELFGGALQLFVQIEPTTHNIEYAVGRCVEMASGHPCVSLYSLMCCRDVVKVHVTARSLGQFPRQ